MSGKQNTLFLQGDLRGLKYQMLSEDLQISCWYASVYPYHLKQILTNEPEKSLLNVCSEA